MRMALLIGLTMISCPASNVRADVLILDPIVAYVKVPLWEGWGSRWYIYTESGFVAPVDDEVPAHIPIQQTWFFDLVWMLNLMEKNVLTPDEVMGMAHCIGWNSPQYLEMRQIPPPPDDFDHVDHCINVGGYKLIDTPPESSLAEDNAEN